MAKLGKPQSETFTYGNYILNNSSNSSFPVIGFITAIVIQNATFV